MLDGSPQGKTAYLTKPYLVPPPGQTADYRGYPAYAENELNGQVKEAVVFGEVDAHGGKAPFPIRFPTSEDNLRQQIECIPIRSLPTHAAVIRLK